MQSCCRWNGYIRCVLASALVWGCTASEEIDRSKLPIPAPKYPTITEVDASQVQAPPLQEITPPAGAPNIVLILTDDVGYGAPQTFGGPVETPALERLAAAL